MVEEQFEMVEEDFDSETIIDGETETVNVGGTETETGAEKNTGPKLAKANNKTRNKSPTIAENKELPNYDFLVLFPLIFVKIENLIDLTKSAESC
jgi:hypothetical protein